MKPNRRSKRYSCVRPSERLVVVVAPTPHHMLAERTEPNELALSCEADANEFLNLVINRLVVVRIKPAFQ